MNKHQQGVWGPDPDQDDRLEQLLQLVRNQTPRYEEADPGPTFDLRSIFGLVRRQIWTILGVTVVGVGLAALYLSQVERQYTASALLVVDTQASEMLGVASGLSDSFGMNSALSTEVVIIRSEGVLVKAAEALDIQSSPVMSDEPDTRDWSQLTPLEQNRWAVALGGHLQVAQSGTTNAISIAATTPSPTASADWANAVAEAYIQMQVDSKVRSQQIVLDLLQKAVDAAANNVSAAENDFDEFVRSAIDQVGTTASRNQLAALRAQDALLRDRNADRTALQTALSGQDTMALAVLVEEVAPGVAGSLAGLQAALGRESDTDRAAQIQSEIDALNRDIRTAAATRSQSLTADMETQRTEVGALQDSLNTALVGQDLPGELLAQFYPLQQRTRVARDTYTNSLSQRSTAEFQTALSLLPHSRVIANAIPPEAPSYPSVRTTLIMAFLLAGAAGVGLALLREQFIGGITSPEQLEQAIGLPVVAAIPRHKLKDQEPDWAIVDEPLSAFSEAIRRARIGIESTAIDRQVRLAVTSSAASEGKTTIALALARSFAKAGKSTILVDADLRHPSVHKHLNLDVKFGLIDYLLSGRSADTAHMFIMKEEETGLSMILGSEPSSVATDSLILSDRFSAVVEYCSRDFEVVIFDTPPVGIVVDPQILTRKHATVCLYVVKAEGTPMRAVRAGLKNLALTREVPIVSLLNQVSTRNRYYAKYTGEYYNQ